MTSTQNKETKRFTGRIPDGVYTALITPFQTNGKIDWDSFDRLLDLQVSAGITGLTVCGTTGEAPTLTVQEKVSIVKRAKARAGDKLHIMAGSGSNNTSQSIELSKLCQDAGADSLLVVTPPYNKPSQTGLLQHFGEISKAVSIPICLYHVPGRTAQLLPEESLSELAGLEGIDSIKEASADLCLLSRLASNQTASILSGDDMTFLPSLAAGGSGLVSVATNLMPEVYVKIHKLFNENSNAAAIRLHQAVLPLAQSLFWDASPAPLKSLMAGSGLCQNHLRLPLCSVADKLAGSLQELYQKTRNNLEEMSL